MSFRYRIDHCRRFYFLEAYKLAFASCPAEVEAAIHLFIGIHSFTRFLLCYNNVVVVILLAVVCIISLYG